MDLSQTSLLPCIYITSLLPSLRPTILLCRLELQWHPQCTSDSSPCSPSTNQVALLVLVVNTAVIGNYSEVNVGVKVPGILTPEIYNGSKVDLLPFFSGGLASTNDGVNSTGVVQNFLDGGAAPLMANIAANGTSSNQ